MAIYKGNTKIVKLYKGATEIVRRYKGTNLIYQNSLLPAGYIRLDYIENPDQNAYINTGILPDDTTGFKVRMSVRDITTDLYYLGCRESNSTDSRFGLGVYQGHTYMAFGTYYSDANNWTITRGTPFVAENNYKNSRVATMDGLNPVSVGTLSGITFTRNIYLFKLNQPTLQITSNCRIYDCEITQGNSVVARFIPCLDNNGVACMYDVIRKQTFYSAGSSNFIYIPPVIIPSGYTLLECLESTGTQYIDTGYYATTTSGINIDYAYAASGNAGLCGIFQGQAPRTDTLFITTNSGQTSSAIYLISQGAQLTNNVVPTLGTKYNAKINYLNNGKLIIDNTTTGNNGSNGVVSTRTIKLFCRDNGGNLAYTNARIYRCQISEGTTLVRDLVPCLDDQNVPCMYDVVGKQTYYNAGTGTFIAG